MDLTDTQLKYFVENRLKLPKGKRAEYLAQVDHLIERFAAAAKDDKVIGSWSVLVVSFMVPRARVSTLDN